MPVILLVILLSICATASGAGPRPVLELRAETSLLVVDLGGGSIADFQLSSEGLNPLGWDSWYFSPDPASDPPMEPRSMGHFLCLDRWGSASDAEKANGISNHGEASAVWWEVSQNPLSNGGVIEAVLTARLPLAGMHVERTIRLLDQVAVFSVTESVTNTNPIGRIYNMVQHPTIGGPFLDEQTVVDTNATRGFMQETPMPTPEDPEVRWPNALQKNGTRVDLRYLKGDPHPQVVSFVMDDEYGWITATSPSSGLLIGYLWKVSDYPWVNVWRNARNGKPFARGLEFGTSGLHRPGHDLVSKGKIFDRALYRYIDASETQTFSYVNFLCEFPDSWSGVSSVQFADGSITINEAEGSGRALELEVGRLF